jgi:hypothetical protein
MQDVAEVVFAPQTDKGRNARQWNCNLG